MKFSSFRFSSVLVLVALFSIYAFSQNDMGKYDLLLKIGSVNLAENFNEYSQYQSIVAEKSINGRVYKIIQFYEIPTSNAKTEIQALGVELIEYIPNYAFVASIPEGFEYTELSSFGVRSISSIISMYKQDPYILDKEYPQWALREGGQIDVIISYFRDISFSYASSEISRHINLIIQNDDFANVQIARVNLDDLKIIIEQPYVQYVEPFYPSGEPENYSGKTLHRSNVLDSKLAMGRHYDGEGVNVMLQDDGVIGPHADYQGRIGEQYINSNYGNHGDHCAGIITGAGNIDPTTTGQAPGATIFVYGAAPTYPGFNSIPQHYSDPGIRITSTSYSDGCNAGYTNLARTMDLQIRNYESLMHVFSAGNAGNENCGYGAGSGWGNVTGGHKIGKNVIATANLDYKDVLSNSSSRGPAHDGRIKPDISAKGSDVYSTIDPHTYSYKSGTSMSCPGISGSLAQLYDAYRDLNGGSDPKGGFMKALVLNTADDIGNPGPDFKHGWGRINNLRAVKVLENGNYMSDEIEQGETIVLPISVPENVKQLKVMVYWTDKEANVNTNKALVNDLNISLSDPSDIDFLPWVLSSYPHPDSLNKNAIRGIDELNNMEQVTIDGPASGAYELLVDGNEVPFGPQEFFVIYDFVMDEIDITYPIGGEAFSPGESIVVRWDAFGNEENFIFEYSSDNGQSWEEVTSNINGSARYYNWSLPSAITGEALIKISRNGISDSSDETFTIMGIPSDIYFDRSCPNSVLISWEPVDEAESYDVYQLGEKYMEVIGTTTADSLLVDGISSEEEHWFSVSAHGPDDIKGRRAIAELKETGVWNCIFNKDLAVSDLISPPSGYLFNCQDYSDLMVKIELSNTGMQALENFTVSFQFEEGNVMSENFTGMLEPGERIIYEFASTINLPSTGNYDFKAWIEHPDDENYSNDESETILRLKIPQWMSMNSTENFDNFTSCGFEPDCEDVNCVLDGYRWYNLANGMDDDIDWRTLNGITPTPGTGPIGDHTTGTIEGNFLYLEPTGECYNKEAILMSPCIDVGNSTNPGISFWYNMLGSDMGTLHVDIISDATLIKDVILPISGDHGSGWKQAFVYLVDYTDKVINLRFRGTTANGELGDLAIDDVLLTELTGVEALANESQQNIRVYPNPSSGIYNLLFSESSTRDIKITVSDLLGRNVISRSYSPIDMPSNQLRINLSDEQKGIYYVHIDFGDEVIMKKIVKY